MPSSRAGCCSWGTIILSWERMKRNGTEQSDFKTVGTHLAQGLSVVLGENSYFCGKETEQNETIFLKGGRRPALHIIHYKK